MPGRPRFARGASSARLVVLATLTGACSGAIEKAEGPTSTPSGSSPTGKPPMAGAAVPGPGTTPAGMPGGSPGNGTGSAPIDPKLCGPAPARIWKLTPDQITRTAQALLKSTTVKPGDEIALTLAGKKVGFSNDAAGLEMSEPHVAQLLQTGRGLAVQAITAGTRTAPCLANPDSACVKAFVESFGARAHRRDLSPTEVGTYVDFFTKQATAHGAPTALRLAVTAIFMSPSFLYRTELGAETSAPAAGKAFALTGFEKAQALSYFVSDGPPDDMLFAAAKNGRLETKEQLGEHARRLTTTPAGSAGLLKFFEEHYDTHLVTTVKKDTKIFPDWKPELPGDMVKEADAFLADVLWKNDGKLQTLYTAGYTMASGRLAGHYGMPGLTNTTFDKLAVPNRAGLLTLPTVMASIARENDTDPVARGKFVRTVLLCQTLPQPPAEVNAVPVPPDGKRTQRERLGQHSKDPSCAGCHNLIDPLGLPFETYDGIGKYRATDLGKAIDASGVLRGARPDGATFTNAVELAALLARSPDASQCFVTKVFEYAGGRARTDADACTLDGLAKRFEQSGGHIIDIAVGIATDEAFVTRRQP